MPAFIERFAGLAGKLGGYGADIGHSKALRRAAASRPGLTGLAEARQIALRSRGYRRMGVAGGIGAGVIMAGRRGRSSGATGRVPPSSTGGMY